MIRHIDLSKGAVLVKVIEVKCIGCGVVSHLQVNALGLERLKTVHVQHAFPELNADEREMVLTGTHTKCWDEMMMDDDE